VTRPSTQCQRCSSAHFYRLHEPARLVSADGQQREIDRAETLPDVAEERRIRRVAGKIYPPAARDDHESAPQRAISIERASGGKVVRPSQRDRERRRLRVLPPIEFLHAPDPR